MRDLQGTEKGVGQNKRKEKEVQAGRPVEVQARERTTTCAYHRDRK